MSMLVQNVKSTDLEEIIVLLQTKTEDPVQTEKAIAVLRFMQRFIDGRNYYDTKTDG